MSLLTLRFLHILFMGTLFGAAMFVTSDVKSSLSDPNASMPLLRRRIGKSTRFMAISGIMTIVTGFALIFAMGGFKAMPTGIHIGTLGGLIAMGLGITIGATWRGIDAELEKGTAGTELLAQAKRLAMFTGMFHLTWFVTLVLMVFRGAI